MKKRSMKTRWFAVLLTAIMVLAVSCKGDEGPMGPQGPAGPQGVQGAQGIPGKDGNLFYYGNGAPAASLGKAGDMYLDKAASKLYGPKTASGWGTGKSLIGPKGATGAAGSQILSGNGVPAASLGKKGDWYFDKSDGSIIGPKPSDTSWSGLTWTFLKGPKGDKGDKGDMGNANVKSTAWIAFDIPSAWIKLKPDFCYFKDVNYDWRFSAQTIKDIESGKYVSICYVKKQNGVARWTLPAFFAVGDFPEFGTGRKMMNYVLHPKADGSDITFELNVTSTDGTAVTGATYWYYRVVFISVDGGTMRSAVSAEALKEELQQLSYEEVCARYGIEP